MIFVTDKFHDKRLKDNNVVINTIYNSVNKQLERDSNNLEKVDMNDGILLEKRYLINEQICHIEKEFDSRIHYSYIASDVVKKDSITCPNCGYTDKPENFTNGCNHCGSYYNIDYSEKDLGSKNHYDKIIHSHLYIFITLIFDLLVSFFLAFIYVYNNSRTFNIYDIGKIIVFTLLISIVLFIVFYLIDGLIVLLPIKIYKDRVNNKQIKFWNRMKDLNIDKNKFFNNFNYELNCYYYNNDKNKDVIDYDVIDYLNFNEYYDSNKNMYLDVEVLIRVIYLDDGKIKSKTIKKMFKLKKAIITDNLKDGMNVINCHNCGASIDATSDKCEYCGKQINYLQEWYIIN